MRRLPLISRLIALALIGAFGLQEIAIAAPASGPLLSAHSRPAVELPASTAMMDGFYSAGASAPLIILIQDAHTNPSGQINIARALDHILGIRPISTVYLEAGNGDVSLTDLKAAATTRARRDVGLLYLRKGLLQGSEFANLTSDRDFKLWGVENRALYERALRTYGKVVKLRPLALAALARIIRAYELVRDARYGPGLSEWDAIMRRHRQGEIPIAEYAAKISDRLASLGRTDSIYPNLKSLTNIQNNQARIDFVQAQKELRSLAATAREETVDPAERLLIDDFLSGGSDEDRVDAVGDLLYDVWKQRSKKYADSPEGYQNAGLYLAQRMRVRALATAVLFEEIRAAEIEIGTALAYTDEERRLLEIGRALDGIKAAIELRQDAGLFAELKNAPSRLSTAGVMGYLNRQILELDRFYEKAPSRTVRLEEALKLSVDFYTLAERRDRMFWGLMRRRMKSLGEKQAVLIVGGYHSEHLKKMFREHGVSYVSFVPRVSHETDGARYEKLLLNQEKYPLIDQPGIASPQTTIGLLQIRAAGNGDAAARFGQDLGERIGVPTGDAPASGARMADDAGSLEANVDRIVRQLERRRGEVAGMGLGEGISDLVASWNEHVRTMRSYGAKPRAEYFISRAQGLLDALDRMSARRRQSGPVQKNPYERFELGRLTAMIRQDHEDIRSMWSVATIVQRFLDASKADPAGMRELTSQMYFMVQRPQKELQSIATDLERALVWIAAAKEEPSAVASERVRRHLTAVSDGIRGYLPKKQKWLALAEEEIESRQAGARMAGTAAEDPSPTDVEFKFVVREPHTRMSVSDAVAELLQIAALTEGLDASRFNRAKHDLGIDARYRALAASMRMRVRWSSLSVSRQHSKLKAARDRLVHQRRREEAALDRAMIAAQADLFASPQPAEDALNRLNRINSRIAVLQIAIAGMFLNPDPKYGIKGIHKADQQINGFKQSIRGAITSLAKLQISQAAVQPTPQQAASPAVEPSPAAASSEGEDGKVLHSQYQWLKLGSTLSRFKRAFRRTSRDPGAADQLRSVGDQLEQIAGAADPRLAEDLRRLMRIAYGPAGQSAHDEEMPGFEEAYAAALARLDEAALDHRYKVLVTRAYKDQAAFERGLTLRIPADVQAQSLKMNGWILLVRSLRVMFAARTRLNRHEMHYVRASVEAIRDWGARGMVPERKNVHASAEQLLGVLASPTWTGNEDTVLGSLETSLDAMLRRRQVQAEIRRRVQTRAAKMQHPEGARMADSPGSGRVLIPASAYFTKIIRTVQDAESVREPLFDWFRRLQTEPDPDLGGRIQYYAAIAGDSNFDAGATWDSWLSEIRAGRRMLVVLRGAGGAVCGITECVIDEKDPSILHIPSMFLDHRLRGRGQRSMLLSVAMLADEMRAARGLKQMTWQANAESFGFEYALVASRYKVLVRGNNFIADLDPAALAPVEKQQSQISRKLRERLKMVAETLQKIGPGRFLVGYQQFDGDAEIVKEVNIVKWNNGIAWDDSGERTDISVHSLANYSMAWLATPKTPGHRFMTAGYMIIPPGRPFNLQDWIGESGEGVAGARLAKDSRWTDRIPPRRVQAYRRMAMQIADRIERDKPLALLIDAPSGLGKTTLATAVEEELRSRGLDSSRIGLDLFMHSDEARKQNNARILAAGEARTDEYRRVWRTRVLDRFFDQLFEYLASKPARRDRDQKSIRIQKAFIRDYKELDPDWKALNPDVPAGIHKAFAPLTIPLKRDLKIIEGKFVGNIKALSRYSDRILYVRMDGGAYRAKVQFLQRYRKTMTSAELRDRARLHDLYTAPSYFSHYEPATRRLVDLFAQVTDPRAENWTVREPAGTGSTVVSKQLYAAAAARMAADRRQKFLFKDGGSGLMTAIAVIAWAPTFAGLTVLSVLGSDWARRRWLGTDMPAWYRRGITAFMIILSTVPGLPRGVSPIISSPMSEDRVPAQPALPARRRLDESESTMAASSRTDLVESAVAYGEMVEEHVGHDLGSIAVMLTNYSQLLLADELRLGPSDKVLSYYPDTDVSFGAFMLGAALRGATADVAQVQTGIDYMRLWSMIRFYLEDLTRQKYSDDLWKGIETRLRVLPTNEWGFDEPTWTDRIGGPYTHVYLPLMPPYVNDLDKILASLADDATLIVVGEGGSWNPEFAWRRTLFEINERHPETVYELIPEGRKVLTYGVLHLHNEALLFKIHRKRPADFEQMGLPDAEAVKELRQMEFMLRAREQKLKWSWTEIPSEREQEDHFKVGNTIFIRRETGGSLASIERSEDRRVIRFADVPTAGGQFIVNGVNTMLALKTLDETIRNMNGSAFTAVDVGAGAGALTLLLADNDLSRRVYAVEPDPTALEMLQDNLFANRIRYDVVESAEQFLRAVKDPDHHVIVVAGTVGDFHQWVDRADPDLVFPADTETLYTANMPRGTLNAVLPKLKARLFGAKSGPLSARGIWLHLTGIEQQANIESAAVFVSDGDIEGAIQQKYPAQWLETFFDEDDLQKQGWRQRIAKRAFGQHWDVLAALIHRPAAVAEPLGARMAAAKRSARWLSQRSAYNYSNRGDHTQKTIREVLSTDADNFFGYLDTHYRGADLSGVYVDPWVTADDIRELIRTGSSQYVQSELDNGTTLSFKWPHLFLEEMTYLNAKAPHVTVEPWTVQDNSSGPMGYSQSEVMKETIVRDDLNGQSPRRDLWSNMRLDWALKGILKVMLRHGFDAFVDIHGCRWESHDNGGNLVASIAFNRVEEGRLKKLTESEGAFAEYLFETLYREWAHRNRGELLDIQPQNRHFYLPRAKPMIAKAHLGAGAKSTDEFMRRFTDHPSAYSPGTDHDIATAGARMALVRSELLRLAPDDRAEFERLLPLWADRLKNSVSDGGLANALIGPFEQVSLASILGSLRGIDVNDWMDHVGGWSLYDQGPLEQGHLNLSAAEIRLKVTGFPEALKEARLLRLKGRTLPRYLGMGVFDEQEAVIPVLGGLYRDDGKELTDEELARAGLEWVRESDGRDSMWPVFGAASLPSRVLTIPTKTAIMRLVDTGRSFEPLVTIQDYEKFLDQKAGAGSAARVLDRVRHDFSTAPEWRMRTIYGAYLQDAVKKIARTVSLPMAALQFKGVGGPYKFHPTSANNLAPYQESVGDLSPDEASGFTLVKDSRYPKQGVILTPYQELSGVAIGGASHEERFAVKRDRELLRERANLSALTLATAPVLDDAAMRRLGLAGKVKPLEASLRIVLDDTRSLHDVIMNDLYHIFLRETDSPDEASARTAHIRTVTTILAGNIAACLNADLSIDPNDVGASRYPGFTRNISPWGLIRDTGDLRRMDSPWESEVILKSFWDGLLLLASKSDLGLRDFVRAGHALEAVRYYLGGLGLDDEQIQPVLHVFEKPLADIANADNEDLAYMRLAVVVRRMMDAWVSVSGRPLHKNGKFRRLGERISRLNGDAAAFFKAVSEAEFSSTDGGARMAALSGKTLFEYGARLAEAQPAAVADAATEFAVEFAPERSTWLKIWRGEDGLKVQVFGEVRTIASKAAHLNEETASSENLNAASMSAEEWTELQRVVMEASRNKLDLRSFPEAAERGGVVLHLNGLAGAGQLQQSRLQALALDAARSDKNTTIILEGDESLKKSFREKYQAARGTAQLTDLSEIPGALDPGAFSHVMSRSHWDELAQKVDRPVILEDVRETDGKVPVHIFGPILREAEALSRIRSIDARDSGLRQIFDFHRSLMGTASGTFKNYLLFLEGRGDADLFTLPAIARVGVSEAVRLFSLASRLSRQSA